jgi:dGTPase
LLAASKGEALRSALKEFAFRHAYLHRSVLRIELQGNNVIHRLMDMMWAAIVDREDIARPASSRNNPFTRYVYGRISENYRRVFESPPADLEEFPLRYKECLLLTDMISGMTDSFAVDLCEELSGLIGDFDVSRFLRSAIGS